MMCPDIFPVACRLRWLLCCAAVLACVNACAAELRFAVMDAAPFGFQTERGPGGLYPAILAALSAETGLPIRVQIVPFARASNEVATGSADGTLMFATSTTAGRVVALTPVFSTAQTLQPAPGKVVRSRADLQPMLIGRIRGGCQELEADKSVPWRFYEVNHHQQGIEMLNARRIDALCSTPEALDDASTRFDPQHLLDRSARWNLAYRDVWLMVSTKVDPALHQPLRDGVQRLQRSGALSAIFRNAVGPRYELVVPQIAPERRNERP